MGLNLDPKVEIPVHAISQEVQVDRTYVDHPKYHSLFGLGLLGL